MGLVVVELALTAVVVVVVVVVIVAVVALVGEIVLLGETLLCLLLSWDTIEVEEGQPRFNTELIC